jgi:hypothetical protein
LFNQLYLKIMTTLGQDMAGESMGIFLKENEQLYNKIM